MDRDNQHRYCVCLRPDQKRGYCQNCGERSWPEATQYEDLRRKFDAAVAGRSPFEEEVAKWADAKQKAMDDACAFGTGAYRVHHNGYVEHIPFDQLVIVRVSATEGKKNG